MTMEDQMRVAVGCQRVFDGAWRSLMPDQRRVVHADVTAIMADEGLEHIDAARTLRDRIGGVHSLAGYADCLLAGERRRNAAPREGEA